MRCATRHPHPHPATRHVGYVFRPNAAYDPDQRANGYVFRPNAAYDPDQGQSGAPARLSLRLLSRLATVVMVRMVRMAVSD